jgi:hypothetical protein
MFKLQKNIHHVPQSISKVFIFLVPVLAPGVRYSKYLDPDPWQRGKEKIILSLG